MIVKRIFQVCFFLFLFFSVFSQIPVGYYNSAIGKKNSELKTALFLIIKDANVPDYGSGTGSTWAAFTKTDVRPEDGTVWDMYSNNHVAFNGNSAASGMNIEHSFAKSWWGGGRQAAQDIQHLCPSNSSANSAKGSWPMAVVDGSTTFTNGCIKVGKSSSRPGGVIDAWEPADEYKGDFARMYMYMVTAYENYSADWTGNSVNQLDNNTYPVFEQWTIDMLLKWSRQDPVSQKEITRTNEAYKIQGNRNPYIDYPLLAEYVWGNLKDVAFTPDDNVNYPYLSSPTSSTVVDFGKVSCMHADTASFFLKGTNLSGDLTLSIFGTDATDFSFQNETITKAEAESGCKIILNFLSQTIGSKTATLIISGGGVSDLQISLNAVSSADFTALPAVNINSTGFTANWTASAGIQGYTLNVYTLINNGASESKTLLEEDFVNGLPDSWSSVTYVDNSLASNMKLGSGSNSGKIITPELNLTSASELLVRAKQYSNDSGAQLIATADGQSIATWTTSSTNQDFKVSLPLLSSNSKITLMANSGRRVYVDYVKVTTAGTTQTPENVSGYPKSVGNVLSYDVNSLNENTTYYYTVTPEGNSTGISSVISVTTSGTSELKNTVNMSAYWYKNDNNLVIKRLPENSRVYLIDPVGKAIANIVCTTASDIMIPQLEKGIYIIKIEFDKSVYTGKVSF